MISINELRKREQEEQRRQQEAERQASRFPFQREWGESPASQKTGVLKFVQYLYSR